MGQLWERTTWSTRIAALTAVFGWFVSIGTSNEKSVNGVVTECSGFDAGPLIFGVLTLVLVGIGFAAARKVHPNQRPPEPVFTVVSAVIALVGVALLVKFLLNPEGSLC